MKMNKKHQGIIYIIIGIIIFIAAAGKFLLNLGAAIVALWFINVGLKLYGLPPLLLFIQLFLSKSQQHFKR